MMIRQRHNALASASVVLISWWGEYCCAEEGPVDWRSVSSASYNHIQACTQYKQIYTQAHSGNSIRRHQWG